MLFLLVNRTKAGLRPEDYRRLTSLTADFYANVPPSCRFLGDYNALDWSRNFTLLDVPSQDTITEMMRPFTGYVDIEVIPIQPTEWWAKQGAR